ncbi:MAG: tRNA-dihydrouridine synthase family protein [Spirochaetales bacterium]|nr:tRNA-dihydrouridine synthase family protein [Spirochaetales bacterium]
MKLLFAPLKGLTDAHFRSFYFRHFSGFHAAVAPFLLSSEDEALKAQREGSQISVPLIPQLLGNRIDRLVSFSQLLKDHGFSEYNLNLGCPAPVVVKKSKGSALLTDPVYLQGLLEELCEMSALPFSIKTRLGYENTEQLRPQLKHWNKLPITELIIHGRSARQGYTGKVNWEETARCADEWGREIICNGDITDLEIYGELKETMSHRLGGIMIGRGIFYNPFIAEEIQRNAPLTGEEKRDRFLTFHRDISGEMGTRPKSFSRLKGLWTYFARFVSLPEGELEKMKRLDDPARFCEEAEKWIALIPPE